MQAEYRRFDQADQVARLADAGFFVGAFRRVRVVMTCLPSAEAVSQLL